MLPHRASSKQSGAKARQAGGRRAEPSAALLLKKWGEATFGWGWKTRLQERTLRPGKPMVGWATICRACKDIKVNKSSAKRISHATGGAVPWELLTDERDDDLEEVA